MQRYLLTLLFLCIAAMARAEPQFLVQPTGQATGDSCQSYALGVALAFKRDPKFQLDTASDLRNAENAIRAAIIKASNNAPSIGHDHVKAGFEAYTEGRYKIVMRDVKLGDVGSTAGQRSGVTAAAVLPPAVLASGAIKDVILSSATSINGDQYKNGHIFTILGVDGPPNSSQRLLVLNSGMKIRDTSRNACEAALPDDPGKYTALLSWMPVSNVAFRQFTPGSAKIWTVEKK
jgi:hypothetical protein